MPKATLPIAFLVALTLACGKDRQEQPAAPASAAPAETPPAKADPTPEPSPIFDAPIRRLAGKQTTLAEHRGKALLLVNVASECGFTPQYAGLEELQKKYAARGFSVLGFPCNQFGGQEPGTEEEIQSFCKRNYGVSFPIYEKIEVNGDGRHAIYEELSKHADSSGTAGDIKWNFEKFLVSADGASVTRFRSGTKPEDPALATAIEAALPKK